MSEYDDEGYEDEESGEANSSGPKALRDQLKKVQKERTDALKRLSELEAKFAEADKVNRATSLKEALTAAGGSAAAKVAAFYPTEAEVTADAVKSWLDEYKDVFNLTTAQEAGSEPAPVATPTDPAQQDFFAAQQRADSLETERVESPGEERQRAFLNELGANAKTFDEVIKGLKDAGVPVAKSGYVR